MPLVTTRAPHTIAATARLPSGPLWSSRLALLALLALGGCWDQHATLEPPLHEGRTLLVIYEGRSLAASSAGLPVARRDGSSLVRLLDLWERARQDAAPALDAGARSLAVDFRGADGFQASFSPNCPDEGLGGEHLRDAWWDLDSGNLSFDDEQLPSCYRVKQTTVLLARRRHEPVPAGALGVIRAGAQELVTLDGLSQTLLDGQPVVPLAALVAAAGLPEGGSWRFDLEGAAGQAPGLLAGQSLGPGELALGWLEPVTRELRWAAQLDLDPAWRLADCQRLHVLDD